MSAPLSSGAVQEMRRLLFHTVTDGADGAAGLCAAGRPVVDKDHLLSPTLLAARTCSWYAVPLAKPVMVADVAVSGVLSPPRSVHEPHAGLVAQLLSVAVQARHRRSKSVTAAPFEAGAAQDTQKPRFLTTTVGATGSSGFCAAGAAAAEDDQALSPAALRASTCAW